MKKSRMLGEFLVKNEVAMLTIYSHADKRLNELKRMVRKIGINLNAG
jgi:hypothetical protein